MILFSFFSLKDDRRIYFFVIVLKYIREHLRKQNIFSKVSTVIFLGDYDWDGCECLRLRKL